MTFLDSIQYCIVEHRRSMSLRTPEAILTWDEEVEQIEEKLDYMHIDKGMYEGTKNRIWTDKDANTLQDRLVYLDKLIKERDGNNNS